MDRPKPAALEREAVRTRTCTVDEMFDRIYQGNPFPQDSRFLPTDEGGVFKYFWVDDLVTPYEKRKVVYPIVEVDGVVAGLAKLRQSSYDPRVFCISFVSVDPYYQGRGYARLLAKEIVSFAQTHGITLKATSYSQVGHERLKSMAMRITEDAEVPFIDTDDRI